MDITNPLAAETDSDALRSAERVYGQCSLRLVTSRVWSIRQGSVGISATEIIRIDTHPQTKPRATLKTTLDAGRVGGGQITVEVWGSIGWMPVHSQLIDIDRWTPELQAVDVEDFSDLPESLRDYLSMQMGRVTLEAVGFFI
ncbi:hypothetical protein GCM10025867_49730 (plasmid) [Frondihabitans sucicola]|uniref:ASCH domain-containing protein n=1 Tax=Frondihabitans sucicola TaxID=1268041 RepID=A0ABM8GW79_9MICO|nr:hypothetical protein [Frondihabitans sucicola]BDZ52732.1 hypothetical protein GCM10025867_49730 [Frondihabitans sucicola]